MLRLIFTVCLIDAPDTCEQREMLVYEPMSVLACVMGAMPELAAWKETHPNWRIARWTCEVDRAVEGGGRMEATAQHVSAGADATTPGAAPVALHR